MQFAIVQAETYDEAFKLAEAGRAAPGGAQLCHKIVKGLYGGYSVITIEPMLLADMLTGEMPMLPQLKGQMGALDALSTLDDMDNVA
ncbi:MAG: hypothetical protein ACYYKD_03475 [Rhodospirillales bacterium]